MSGSFAPPGGGSGSASWGGITGTLSAQNDLNTALNARQPIDGDLTTIAALTHSSANFMRSNGTAWQSIGIVESDLPSLQAGKIGSGVFDNARVNWASPGAIGSVTANTGRFSGLSISGTGQITVSSPSRIKAVRTTNQPGTFTAFQFQTVVYNSIIDDPYAQHNTATGRMTIGAGNGGVQMISTGVAIDQISSPQRFLSALYRNGVEEERLEDRIFQAGEFPVLIKPTSIVASPGDILDVRVACGTSGAFTILGGAATTFFKVTKIG